MYLSNLIIPTAASLALDAVTSETQSVDLMRSIVCLVLKIFKIRCFSHMFRKNTSRDSEQNLYMFLLRVLAQTRIKWLSLSEDPVGKFGSNSQEPFTPCWTSFVERQFALQWERENVNMIWQLMRWRLTASIDGHNAGLNNSRVLFCWGTHSGSALKNTERNDEWGVRALSTY